MSDDHAWYLYTSEGQQGPYSAVDLRSWLAAGSITGEWYAWREGMSDWQAISACPELSLTPSRPPSPPKPATPPPAPEPNVAEPQQKRVATGSWKDRMPLPSRGMQLLLAGLTLIAAVTAGIWKFHPQSFGLAPATPFIAAPQKSVIASDTIPAPAVADADTAPDSLLDSGAEVTGDTIGSFAPLAATPKPFLWKIEPATGGAAARKPSWLFGTIHVSDSRIVNLPSSVKEAFSSSRAFFAEIPMDPSINLASMEQMMLPGTKTLKDILPANVYSRLSTFLKSRGHQIEVFGKFRIWAIAMTIQQLDEMKRMTDQIQSRMSGGNPSSGGQFEMMIPLDMKLYNDALATGKKAGGLETLNEQLGALDVLSTNEQVAFLTDSLDELESFDKEGKNMVEELIRFYLRGDIDALFARATATSDPNDPVERKFLKLLIHDRNARMTDRIVDKLKKESKTSFFFAVGAAHMPGDSGIVALLQARGFTVTRTEE